AAPRAWRPSRGRGRARAAPSRRWASGRSSSCGALLHLQGLGDGRLARVGEPAREEGVAVDADEALHHLLLVEVLAGVLDGPGAHLAPELGVVEQTADPVRQGLRVTERHQEAGLRV